MEKIENSKHIELYSTIILKPRRKNEASSIYSSYNNGKEIQSEGSNNCIKERIVIPEIYHNVHEKKKHITLENKGRNPINNAKIQSDPENKPVNKARGGNMEKPSMICKDVNIESKTMSNVEVGFAKKYETEQIEDYKNTLPLWKKENQNICQYEKFNSVSTKNRISRNNINEKWKSDDNVEHGRWKPDNDTTKNVKNVLNERWKPINEEHSIEKNVQNEKWKPEKDTITVDKNVLVEKWKIAKEKNTCNRKILSQRWKPEKDTDVINKTIVTDRSKSDKEKNKVDWNILNKRWKPEKDINTFERNLLNVRWKLDKDMNTDESKILNEKWNSTKDTKGGKSILNEKWKFKDEIETNIDVPKSTPRKYKNDYSEKYYTTEIPAEYALGVSHISFYV